MLYADVIMKDVRKLFSSIYIGTKTVGSAYNTYEEIDIEIEQVAENWNHQVTVKDKDIFFCPIHNIYKK